MKTKEPLTKEEAFNLAVFNLAVINFRDSQRTVEDIYQLCLAASVSTRPCEGITYTMMKNTLREFLIEKNEY